MTFYNITANALPGSNGNSLGDGKNADPLGSAGNGTAGTQSGGGMKAKTCTLSAGPGQPGNTGGGAPPAGSGGDGKPVPTVTLKCVQFSGSLSIQSIGGNGGNGGNGGTGGAGSDGGTGGAQPEACVKEYGISAGGPGGSGGPGGNAGSAGSGSRGGFIDVKYSRIIASPVSNTLTQGGSVGTLGTIGIGGKGGKGGVGSDGKTYAPNGGQGALGSPGAAGNGGDSGSFTATAVDSPEYQLVLSIS